MLLQKYFMPEYYICEVCEDPHFFEFTCVYSCIN